MECIIYQ